MAKKQSTAEQLKELQDLFSLDERIFACQRIAQCLGKDTTDLTEDELLAGFKAAKKAYDQSTFRQQAGPLLRAAIETHFKPKKPRGKS